MQTVDIHTHLLNPNVAFKRFYDRLAITLFAKQLGTSATALKANPYGAYVEALLSGVRNSRYIERICLFPVDSRRDDKGNEIHRDNTVCAFTEDVLAVHAEAPDLIIPFLSINPLRPDALDRIDEYRERGCIGAKFLQNYWGIDLHQQRFIPYYEKLRELKIPLVIHIGSEYSIDSTSAYEKVEMLQLPLEIGVTVIAAHMGLGRFHHGIKPWRNLSKDPAHFDADYFTLLEMLKQHENLYADISGILAPLRARALRHLSEQQDVHHKLLFGTDYPVPFSVRRNSFDLPKPTRREIARIDNPFDRYTQVILHYFPEESPVYSNYQKILPPLVN